jgi:hypothetical protein
MLGNLSPVKTEVNERGEECKRLASDSKRWSWVLFLNELAKSERLKSTRTTAKKNNGFRTALLKTEEERMDLSSKVCRPWSPIKCEEFEDFI